MSVSKITEHLESLPDRLAALLESKSPGSGDAFTRASGKAAGVYQMTPDVYGLKDDAGKPDRAPPKAPWGDEPDVYQAGPRQAKEAVSGSDPTDAWRGKFKLPGTSLSLGSMAAGVVGFQRDLKDTEKQWDDAANWRPGQSARGKQSPTQSEASQQKQNDYTRRLTEVMEQLRDEISKLRESMVESGNESSKEGQGGSAGSPPIGQGPWVALMSRVSGT